MGFQTTTPFTIRPYHPDDLPRLHEICRAAFAPVFRSLRGLIGDRAFARVFGPGGAKQAAHLDAACTTGSGYEIYVAEQEDIIAGFATLSLNRESRIGEIGLNAVAPEFNGQGIGPALYAHLLERMRSSGMCLAQVSTGLDDAHAPARRAYEKAGFKKAIPTINYYMEL